MHLGELPAKNIPEAAGELNKNVIKFMITSIQHKEKQKLLRPFRDDYAELYAEQW